MITRVCVLLHMCGWSVVWCRVLVGQWGLGCVSLSVLSTANTHAPHVLLPGPHACCISSHERLDLRVTHFKCCVWSVPGVCLWLVCVWHRCWAHTALFSGRSSVRAARHWAAGRVLLVVVAVLRRAAPLPHGVQSQCIVLFEITCTHARVGIVSLCVCACGCVS